VVLQKDRAMTQRIELAGVCDGRLAGWIAMRRIEFCRPPNARAPLHNSINLALPATSEISVDLIFSRDISPRREIKSLGFSAPAVHEDSSCEMLNVWSMFRPFRLLWQGFIEIAPVCNPFAGHIG